MCRGRELGRPADAVCPRRQPLPACTQVWLGRGAMALWALLLAYETVHSNRPAFATLLYLWF